MKDIDYCNKAMSTRPASAKPPAQERVAEVMFF